MFKMDWFEKVWDWFWSYRKGKIKYRVWDFGDSYNAMASNGINTVFICYGSTPKDAKEMALYRLNQNLIKIPNIVYKQKL